jgi:hypothetical protein
MTALLYYSYSRYLTEDEIVEIDKKVFRNRELVYRFITRLSSNTKRKTKRVIIVVCLGFVLVFSNVQSVEAIGLSLAPSYMSIEIVQPNYQRPSDVKISPTVVERVGKIYFMANKQIIPLIYLNTQQVDINEKILKRLRGGDLSSNLALIAIGGVVYLILLSAGVDAFAILQQISSVNAPTTSPGFTPTTSSSSTEIALVPTQAQQFNDMSLKFNDPKPNFIMTKDEALKILSKTYPGQLEIRDNERISDWQAAKKIYHVSDFGINPEDYGMTKDNILQLQRIGLTNYVREGRPLPPIKLVKAYQMAVKNMCDHSQHSDGKFSSRGEQKIHQVTYCYNEGTRQVVGFNKETGELITAGKYSPRAFNRFLDTMHLGRL